MRREIVEAMFADLHGAYDKRIGDEALFASGYGEGSICVDIGRLADAVLRFIACRAPATTMVFDGAKFVSAARARCLINGGAMLVNGMGLRGEVLNSLLLSIGEALEESLNGPRSSDPDR